ncbi:DUF2254 domain-containing protein [Pseudalkalibacillus salsuginis]|uniref:DUF2254 domain-containing protein n=1 Tax=Pseudalkalibacillus salsuginis TaxID=2910972 RepID=UPI001F2883C7|nr:DUF2254 domain-containing protein [Pseudalkalibacillus salsuginis]MCF6411143.1 DUF2254 domain-containing protein [Pseudalkalibacillus salsuginis]
MYLKNSLHRIHQSFWYLPAFYSFIATILAYVSVEIDFWMDLEDLHMHFPYFMITDRNTTQLVLGALATSILTMTAITFSSIMVLLSTYLSQYSPRTLDNFLSDIVTRRVLGIFIGSFLYFVLVLVWMNISGQRSFLVIPSLTVSLSAICIGFFVYFIHHVGTWIQVNNLIQDIADNCLSILTSHRVDRSNLDTSAASPWASWENEEYQLKECRKVASKMSGYLQYIDLDRILQLATRDDLIIQFEKNIGNYVDEGTVLFSYWSLDDHAFEIDDYLQNIRVGTQRTTEQDIEYGIQKLTEIALRAISPAVNDPYTAITCIQRLGKILSRLAQTSLEEPYIYDRDKNLRIILNTGVFSQVLYKSFYQIRHYGKQDVSVIGAIFEALMLIAEKSTPSIKDEVWKFAKAIVEGIDRTALIHLDFQYLNDKLDELARFTGHQKEKPLL